MKILKGTQHQDQAGMKIFTSTQYQDLADMNFWKKVPNIRMWLVQKS
jgi:hypothetical protein